MKILILTYYRYPNGDAGSVRQHMFARLFKESGNNVTVIGVGDCTDFCEREYDGIPYISFRYPGNFISSKLKNTLLYKRNLKRYINKCENTFDVIIINDIPVNALFWIKKYSKKQKIQLIHDSVEWYSPEQFKYGKCHIAYILKNMYNTRWIDENFKVIAISSFLMNHFASRGICTIQVPVILDVNGLSYIKKVYEDKLIIMYAGSPGKKDYIKEIIEAMALLSENELSRIELRLIGIHKDQLVGVSSEIIYNLGGHLIALGRISRSDVLKQLEEADFTVLLRSNVQRYAKAGFPTKVVESLASATPVICNVTSDLGKYIVDGENGIIVEECSAKSFANAIRKALNLSTREKSAMQANARKTAEENFDYRKYKHILIDFLWPRNV